MLLACSSPVPLGNGTLAGTLPSGWHDVELDAEWVPVDAVLVIHDDTVPLPLEIVVRRPADPPDQAGHGWVQIDDLTVPAPQTRVGDGWQDNTRRIHRYRKVFVGGAVFEADVQVEVGQGPALRFLRSLRLVAR